jgi:hypothetical protein
MKIILIVLFASITMFAQTSPTFWKLVNGKWTIYTTGEGENTVLKTSPLPVTSAGYFDMSETDFTSGNSNYAVHQDTLIGDSALVFDFGNQFAFASVGLRDTLVTFVDSVKIETYSLGAYNHAIGLKNKFNGVIQSSEVIVFDKAYKEFYINTLYPGLVRVSFYYGANKGTKRVPLVFIGQN